MKDLPPWLALTRLSFGDDIDEYVLCNLTESDETRTGIVKYGMWIVFDSSRDLFTVLDDETFKAEYTGEDTGSILIMLERRRQIKSLGWTVSHDIQHSTDVLVDAAISYANCTGQDGTHPPRSWPWLRVSWKPKDRVKNLYRAGALIAAAIDCELRSC